MNDQIVSAFASQLLSKGYKIVEDVDCPDIIKLNQLEIVPFLKNDEKEITGLELRRRAQILKANLGQKHSDLMLLHQKEIPVPLRIYRLVFPVTLWRDKNNDEGFPELLWRDDAWHPNYHWMGFNLDDRYRLVNIK